MGEIKVKAKSVQQELELKLSLAKVDEIILFLAVHLKSLNFGIKPFELSEEN